MEGPTVLGFSFANGERLNQRDRTPLPSVPPAPPPKIIISTQFFHVYIYYLFQNSNLNSLKHTSRSTSLSRVFLFATSFSLPHKPNCSDTSSSKRDFLSFYLTRSSRQDPRPYLLPRTLPKANNRPLTLPLLQFLQQLNAQP